MNSIAYITCDIHKDDTIVGICMNSTCDHKSRLMCFTCSITEHSEHGRNLVKLSELNKSSLLPSVWPREGIASDAKQFIDQIEILSSHDCLERIDKFFKQFSDGIMEEIERSHQEVRKKVQKLSVNIDLEKLKEIYTSVYDFSKISSLLESLISESIKPKEFTDSLEEYISLLGKPETESTMDSILTGTDENITFAVDFSYLKTKLNELRPFIREISQSMVSDDGISGFKMLVAPSSESFTKVEGGGQEFSFSATYGIVYSSEILEKGIYNLEIQVLSNFNCGYFGLIPESQKDSTSNSYGQGPYQCFHDGCSNFLKNNGTTLESQFQEGGIVEILIDFKNDQFEFGWKGGQAKYSLNSWSIKDQQFRFYVNTYTTNNAKIKLLKSKRRC